MPSATINVKYVNLPKPGKKQGSVKDASDIYYGADPTTLAKMRPGGTYQITYNEREYQGQIYKNISDVKEVGGATASTGGMINGHGGLPARRDDPELAERIFICGAINSILQNPNNRPPASAKDAAAMVAMWRDAWRSAMAPGAAKASATQIGDDMNDEIPF